MLPDLNQLLNFISPILVNLSISNNAKINLKTNDNTANISSLNFQLKIHPARKPEHSPSADSHFLPQIISHDPNTNPLNTPPFLDRPDHRNGSDRIVRFFLHHISSRDCLICDSIKRLNGA